MRRIPLALALVGAVAVTGCMGGTKSSATNDSGVQKGVTDSYYFVNLFNPPIGGIITSDVGGINCGASSAAVSPEIAPQTVGQATTGYQNGSTACTMVAPCTCTVTSPCQVPQSYVYQYYGTAPTQSNHCGQTQFPWSQATVVLTATGQGSTPFAGWAGDCQEGVNATGNVCTLAVGADKTVAAIFGSGGHANFMDPVVHSAAFAQFASGDTAAFKCNTCHGADLKGQGIAPSCFTCHTDVTTFGGHGNAANAAWGDHGGWTQACQRCHTNQGFQDYIGFLAAPGEALASANNLSGSFNSSNPLTASTLAGPPVAGQYAYGPLKCTTCHNSVSEPMSAGITQILFPSLKQVTTDNVTALCGTCHEARESTASLNSKLTLGAVSKGYGIVSVSSSAAGTTTTLVKTGFTASAYRGMTAIFSGNKTPALNGIKRSVVDNDATTITFDPALPVATANGESVSLYYTATGGSTTTLIDASKNWPANAAAGAYVYIQTGANAGLYRQVASNDATTLTLTGALPAAVTAGVFYQTFIETQANLDDTTAYIGSFTNSHYFGAAATVFGADAAGWYQYPRSAGATISGAYAQYTGTNLHGVTAGKCTSCHDAHNQSVVNVTATSCGRCHFKEDGSPVASMTELEESRQFGFEGNIDGSPLTVLEPNGTKSLKVAIDNNANVLYAAIQAYALNVTTHMICYSTADYPYWIVPNADGTCGKNANNTATPVSFSWFTPRLLRAAYNYNFYRHEPGAWAHNPRYVNEVIYDGIVDLNAGLVAKGFTAVPFGGFRAFEGHFGASVTPNHPGDPVGNPNGGDQFRDWDAAVVPNNCSQCHAGQQGLTNAIANQATTLTNKPVMAMQCTTCHAPAASDTNMKTIRTDVVNVYFPPNKAAAKQVAVPAAAFPKAADAVCAECHTARENTTTLNDKIAGNGGLACSAWTGTTTSCSFTNPHYFGAAGVLFGNNTHMLYEYTGKTYAGVPVNWGSPHGSPHGGSCTGCHQPKESAHTFEANLTWCNTCHVQASYGDFRLPPLKTNITNLSNMLYAKLTAASQAAGAALCYNGQAYPYWYLDNGAGGGIANDGICQAGETTGARFNAAGLRAAYNYKWSLADPGAYAHNYEYIAQVLIDGILELDPAAVLPIDAKTGVAIVRPTTVGPAFPIPYGVPAP